MKCPACGNQHSGGGKFCRFCGTLISSTTAGSSASAGAGLGAGFGTSRFSARPHRGAMVLTFGILGLVFCVIFGLVAWIMARADLRAMSAGGMDRAGEGTTRAGMICGIISVVLNMGVFLLYFVVFGLYFAVG